MRTLAHLAKYLKTERTCIENIKEVIMIGKRVLGIASVVETRELGTVFVCETGPTQDSRTISLVDTGQTEYA